MRVIANPPIGVYSNPETQTRHAVFLLLLDTIARYKSTIEDQIIFPSTSYNLFGKKSERWAPGQTYDQTLETIKNITLAKIKSDFRRANLSLSSTDVLFDVEDVCVDGVRRDFVFLHSKGYILERNGEYYLDCGKIAKDTDLKGMLSKVNVHPQKAAGELEAMLEQNTEKPIHISKDTLFSPSNPLGGQNIGPLFVLSNLWDHKYSSSEFTFAASNDVVAKYAFLRFISRAAIDGRPGFDELVVWPRVSFKEGEENWSLDCLAKDPHQGDMLRCALLSCYPIQDTDITIDMGKYKGARNFVYLVANLRNILHYRKDKLRDKDIYQTYDQDMRDLKYPKILQTLEMRVRSISKEINALKDSEKLEIERDKLEIRYSSILDMLNPFMPSISNLVKQNHGTL